MKEMWVRSLGWEDPQEKERATHSGIFAWDITWTEEPGGLYPQGYKESGMTQQLNHNTKQMFSEKKMPPLKPVHWSSQCGSRLPLYLEEQPCPAKAVGFSTGGTPSCEIPHHQKGLSVGLPQHPSMEKPRVSSLPSLVQQEGYAVGREVK